MTIHDAHCHFLTPRFFEALGLERHGRPAPADQVARDLGWEAPESTECLVERWVKELDRNRVSRVALMASIPGDEESVSAAVRAFPERFVGFFVVNPLAPDAVSRARAVFAHPGMRCACLFAALHNYTLDSEPVERIFELAAEHHGGVFAHCGYLSIEARMRLGLPSVFDLHRGDPLALARTAARFPNVPVIIPHFGAGFLREALMAAEAAPNIVLDTSSSNSWVRFLPGVTLADVFRQALAVVGPDRLVFGTDSSHFPRGWRRVIVGAQRTILDELGVEVGVREQIFSRNFDRLFPVREQGSGIRD